MQGGKITETKIEVPDIQSQGEAADQSIIQTWGLTKIFGNEVAVKDVTINVPQAHIFGFIGPSGSGKTTTIRMLTGYYQPTEGRAEVLGESPIHFTRKTQKKIGYMPQLFVLYPNLSVWENLNFAASIYGVQFFRKGKLREILDFVQLYEHRHKLVRNISGGMQRRLSMAATLVHDPTLIFLDEPTAGIDPVLRSKFWDRFRELRDEGRTLFVTTQYVSEAAYCDLVAVMGDGELLMVDTPDGLRYRAYGGDVVEMRTAKFLDYPTEMELQKQPYITGKIEHTGDLTTRMVVKEASTAMPALIEWFRNRGIEVISIEEFLPPFDEVFVELVKEEDEKSG